MSALKEPNGKYRRTWKIWGDQMIPSPEYKKNFDLIEWGNKNKKMKREPLSSESHYRIKFESE